MLVGGAKEPVVKPEPSGEWVKDRPAPAEESKQEADEDDELYGGVSIKLAAPPASGSAPPPAGSVRCEAFVLVDELPANEDLDLFGHTDQQSSGGQWRRGGRRRRGR